MWPELIQFESQKSKDAVPVLLIDTEGIGSVEEDTNHDVKVFLLAMLMSSYFIYNSVGTIDDLALQNLGLIVNGCLIASRSTSLNFCKKATNLLNGTSLPPSLNSSGSSEISP